MTLHADHFITPEEYLAGEERAGYKSEYYDGEVFAMVGASMAHVVISGNFLSTLNQQLRGKQCQPLGGDMQVMVSRTKYFYPDVSVVCGKPAFANEKKRSLLNPAMVVEVLSPSTARFDREKKFRAYASVASLTDYILVSQEQPVIEHYTRQPNSDWLLHIASGLDAAFDVASIGCRIALADLYDRVEFEPEPFEPRPKPDEL